MKYVQINECRTNLNALIVDQWVYKSQTRLKIKFSTVNISICKTERDNVVLVVIGLPMDITSISEEQGYVTISPWRWEVFVAFLSRRAI